jgi:hypothetical protein
MFERCAPPQLQITSSCISRPGPIVIKADCPVSRRARASKARTVYGGAPCSSRKSLHQMCPEVFCYRLVALTRFASQACCLNHSETSVPCPCDEAPGERRRKQTCVRTSQGVPLSPPRPRLQTENGKSARNPAVRRTSAQDYRPQTLARRRELRHPMAGANGRSPATFALTRVTQLRDTLCEMLSNHDALSGRDSRCVTHCDAAFLSTIIWMAKTLEIPRKSARMGENWRREWDSNPR